MSNLHKCSKTASLVLKNEIPVSSWIPVRLTPVNSPHMLSLWVEVFGHTLVEIRSHSLTHKFSKCSTEPANVSHAGKLLFEKEDSDKDTFTDCVWVCVQNVVVQNGQTGRSFSQELLIQTTRVKKRDKIAKNKNICTVLMWFLPLQLSLRSVKTT